MKKIFSLWIAIFMIINMFSFVANGESETVISGEDYASDEVGKSYNILKKYVDVETFVPYLREQLLNCAERVDISSYRIDKSSDFINGIYDLVWHEMFDMFHVKSIGYSYSSHIVSLNFNYIWSGDEFTAMYNDLLSEANRLVSGIKGNNSLSEMEKALLLHDRLALECEYDYTYSDQNANAYGAIVRDSAVCQGYAMAYGFLLEQVGINNQYVSSESLNHGWNMVYIDGVPYHVDVTWDDIAWSDGGRGAVGSVGHENFLRSTSGIISTGHNASDFNSTPTNTKYDNYFWSECESPFLLVENEIYYIDSGSESLKRLSDNAELCKVEGSWSAGGGYYWTKNYAKLATDGKDLFYSLPTAVYKYNIRTGKTSVLYQPTLADDNSIYGIEYSDGYIVCDINTAPPYSGGTNLHQLKYKVEAEEQEIHIKENSGYSKYDKYLLGACEKTTVADLLENFNNENVVVLNASGVEISGDSLCGTGCVALLPYGEKTAEALEIVISGDVDGNGIVDSTDYLKIKNLFATSSTIDGAYFLAADTEPDGEITSTDYIRVKAHFVGDYNLFS